MSALPVLEEVVPLRVAASVERRPRAVPEEQPIAIVCNGTTLAVMMATPADLADFGVGFLISEGIIARLDDIERSDIIEHDQGVEVRHWIAEDRMRAVLARRRRMIGPTGCGLCGIESLAQAARALPAVETEIGIDASDLRCAMAGLRDLQILNAQTRAVHAAALWTAEHGHVLLREDVGRHNALDKLIGAKICSGHGPGVLLLTSRISIELVQKAAIAGFPIIAAISVPTSTAIRVANDAGITLVGVARDDGFEIFAHAYRIREFG